MGMSTKPGIVCQCIILLLFLVFICVSPVFLCLALSFAAIRFLLTLYKNKYKPEFGDFLAGVNSIFSLDSPYENPLLNVSSYILVEGHLSVDELRKTLETKFQEFEKHPKPWFPEMKEYPSSWMGFAIMKKEVNFQMKDHVKLLAEVDKKYENFQVTPENSMDISYKLSRMPFEEQTSPWECLLHYSHSDSGVNGVKKEYTQVFWRWHHTLGDALSFLKLWCYFDQRNSDAFDAFLSKFSKSVVRIERSPLEKMVHAISFPFIGLYELSSTIVNSFWDNPWLKGKRLETLRRRRDYYNMTFDPIPKEMVKGIQSRHGNAKFFDVLLTALAGSLRRFMMSRGVEIPETVHAAVLIPIPRKATRLSNNITNCMLQIPTGLKDRRQILRVIEQDSVETKNSRYPLTVLVFSMLLGTFPKKLSSIFNIYPTVVASNFPGFDREFYICDRRILQLSGFTCSTSSLTGINFFVGGFSGELFITFGMSEDIVSSNEELKQVQEFFLDELEALQTL